MRVAPKLDEESLLAAASAATGLTDFGEDTFRPGLRVLLDSLDGEAQLTTIGRIAARRRLINVLATRLQLLDYRKARPGITTRGVTRPIFVLGLPRTGTTVLYGMLASNPALRAPASWEVARPFPPSEPSDRDDDPRITAVDKEFTQFRRLAPAIDVIHPLGARLPQECLALQAPEFASYEYPTTFPVSSYWAWLRTQDLRNAYEFEAMFLQHLQTHDTSPQWLLKTPAHLMWLDTLLAVFPDALIVHTHRDPAAVLASVSSLMFTLRSAFSDAVVRAEVGREQLDAWTWGLDRTLRARDRLADERVVDVHYTDTVNDPVGTVRRVYEHFDLEFTSAVEQGVVQYLADNPRDKHGAHRCTLEEFSLHEGEVSDAFGEYRRRFQIDPEQRS